MNVEELINKKKEEIIEEVKSETEGLHESISNTAVEKLEKFAAELKMVIDMNPIGAKDLLKIIEKNGFVYQGMINVQELRGTTESPPWRVLEELASRGFGGHRSLWGKQRVTIIIEPLEQ